MTAKSLRIKFITDVEFAAALKADAAKHPDELIIESERSEKEATRLGFDLATAVAIVAIVKGSIDAAAFAAKVYRWWRGNKSKTVVLQTPFKTLELHSNSDFTEEEIREFLKASMVSVK